jgi:3-hydroxyisobutyrate dehydrogenase
LRFGEKAGIDITRIPTALAGGFADSMPLQLTGQRMENGEFEDLKWRVRTLLKDLSISDELARALKTNTPMSALAHQLMKHYCEYGYAYIAPSALIQAHLD